MEKVMENSSLANLLNSDIFVLYKREKPSMFVLKEKPFQVSSQKKQEDPLLTVATAIPFKTSSSFLISHHKKNIF